MTAVTHLNSKTFKRRYLQPNDATEDPEADDQDSSEEEEEGDEEVSDTTSEADSDSSSESQESKNDDGDASQSPCRYELANWMYLIKSFEIGCGTVPERGISL